MPHFSPEKDSSGFVLLSDFIPSIIQEIRYFSTFNFIGERIDGYEEPIALLTKDAARALKTVANEMNVEGYRLKIFDAYRPTTAVKHFILWGIEDQDVRMKPYFYPNVVKQDLFSKGYIAKKSSHSRGSTVDLTLLDMATGKELDMGSQFDWFGHESSPNYGGDPGTLEYNPGPEELITPEQFYNRMILRSVMVKHGFKTLDSEWWHFTLENEPYPDTYFNFPVKQ